MATAAHNTGRAKLWGLALGGVTVLAIAGGAAVAERGAEAREPVTTGTGVAVAGWQQPIDTGFVRPGAERGPGGTTGGVEPQGFGPGGGQAGGPGMGRMGMMGPGMMGPGAPRLVQAGPYWINLNHVAFIRDEGASDPTKGGGGRLLVVFAVSGQNNSFYLEGNDAEPLRQALGGMVFGGPPPATGLLPGEGVRREPNLRDPIAEPVLPPEAAPGGVPPVSGERLQEEKTARPEPKTRPSFLPKDRNPPPAEKSAEPRAGEAPKAPADRPPPPAEEPKGEDKSRI
jgi:hypothetical protein